MVQKLIVPMQKTNKSFLWWLKVEASPKINVKQNTHTPCKNDDIITIIVIPNESMNHHDSFACLQRYCLKYGYRLHPVPDPQVFETFASESPEGGQAWSCASAICRSVYQWRLCDLEGNFPEHRRTMKFQMVLNHELWYYGGRSQISTNVTSSYNCRCWTCTVFTNNHAHML